MSSIHQDGTGDLSHSDAISMLLDTDTPQEEAREVQALTP